ncbi:rhodanese-like domain-containing protein [Gammaproteobacteria bacterium AB-CW1]|uniref:Rhodanese-like domain-containing protein n=1 Tax=Natronospira elongata TaxID=3110268 RepID=A0AAP6JDL1_9GAMM|nr:rhodanese-like domain-containing protein [Gammaproteobacteria bacterium AB-CW1]
MDRVLEFASHHPILVLALVSVFALFLFTEFRRLSRPYREVEPGQATRLINDGAVVVDVRQPDVFKRGHIAGAANYPADRFDAFEDELNKRLKQAKTQMVLLYCEMGMTSARTATQLAKKQAELDVVHLKGGITAWQRENLPLRKG